MDGVPQIETEWGSELHLPLIAEKARLRQEGRDSPEAMEDVRRMAAAPPLRWEGVFTPKQKTGKMKMYVWSL